jgi:hypothetical protein
MKSLSLSEALRERAVENVDRRHGYTMEFAPSPQQHKLEYDEEERKLKIAVADDPGLILCGHAHRNHYLGGGLKVCFECWARMLMGRV